MFGNTTGMSAGPTPYHDASVAAYCSTDAVGIQRPRLSVSLGTAQLQHREHRAVRSGDAVEVAAAHRAADDEVVVAPRVIGADDAGAGAGRLQRAAEIGQRERRDLLVHPELDGRIDRTRLHRLADLRSRLACVATWFWCVSNPPSWQKKICRVSPSAGDGGVELDHLGDLLQLVAERRVREHRPERHVGC